MYSFYMHLSINKKIMAQYYLLLPIAKGKYNQSTVILCYILRNNYWKLLININIDTIFR